MSIMRKNNQYQVSGRNATKAIKRDGKNGEMDQDYFVDDYAEVKIKRRGKLGPVDFFDYNYPTNHFWFRLLGPLAKLIIKIGWNVKYEGLENVPKDGNYIIMPNHVSHFDAPLVIIGLWPRPMTHEIADEKLFYNRYLRILAKMFNAFPVRKKAKNLNLVEYAINRVYRGDGMIWFPEGQRHKSPSDNCCYPGKLGSGMIAHRVIAPVIPVFIAGAEFAMPVGKKLTVGKGFRSIKILVKFGKPVPLDDLRELPACKATSQLVVNRIIEKIEELRPKGPYRDQSHR